MPPDANREFLARDVYPTWRRRVKAATSEVLLFSPYLDRLAVSLLGNASLSASQIGVVTDLSPASGAQDYRGQLLAIRALLNAEIEVRSLARLHAKILLVDGGAVTVGSQNFTSYARRSNEATVAPTTNLSGTHLVATLRAWHRDAEVVDPAFVERLLSSLTAQTKAMQAAHEDLVAAFEAAERAHRAVIEARRRAEEERLAQRKAEEARAAARLAAQQAAAAASRASIERGLAQARSKTRYRSAQQSAYARMETEWSDANWRYQQHLQADARSDLTAWKRYDGTGWRDYRLTRLRYYPLILQPSGRMAYARVGQSRIAFLRDSVDWGALRSVTGRRLSPSVAFPDRNLHDGNIVLTLRQNAGAGWGCRSRLRFTGQDCILVRIETFGTAPGQVIDDLHSFCVQAWDDDPASLLRTVFDSLRYKKVGIGFSNAADYFTADRYRLDLIEYVDRPILVATAE